jgi:hypothetical protein
MTGPIPNRQEIDDEISHLHDPIAREEASNAMALSKELAAKVDVLVVRFSEFQKENTVFRAENSKQHAEVTQTLSELSVKMTDYYVNLTEILRREYVTKERHTLVEWLLFGFLGIAVTALFGIAATLAVAYLGMGPK